MLSSFNRPVKGFTLIEIVIVMTIMSIIGVVALTQLGSFYYSYVSSLAKTTQDTEIRSVLRSIESDLTTANGWAAQLVVADKPVGPTNGSGEAWSYCGIGSEAMTCVDLAVTSRVLIAYSVATDKSSTETNRLPIFAKTSGSCDYAKPIKVVKIYFVTKDSGDPTINNLYRRTIVNPNNEIPCDGMVPYQQTTCSPAVLSDPACKSVNNTVHVDAVLLKNVQSFDVQYYAAANDSTPLSYATATSDAVARAAAIDVKLTTEATVDGEKTIRSSSIRISRPTVHQPATAVPFNGAVAIGAGSAIVVPNVLEVGTSCAVVAGRAYCWGTNDQGQIGNNTTTDSKVPVAVSTSGQLFDKTITAISAGSAHSCAIADDQAYCWGDNGNGQLGNNSTTSRFSYPVAVTNSGVLAGKTVTSLSVGASHTCVVADDRAYCWGYNNSGQLGNGTTTDSRVPVAVSTTGVLSGKTVTAISVGYSHTCAIADGNGYCWGANTGRLGNNSAANSSVPVAVSTSGVLAGKTVTAISAGGTYSCGIADDQAYCWGGNSSGQLGNGTTNDTIVPVAVSTSGVLAGKTVTTLSAGFAHTCAIADNRAYCWGGNGGGRLGNNSTTNSNAPIAVNISYM